MSTNGGNDPDDTPHLDAHQGDGVVRATTRMEAFADAVFAIAFTIPVVEVVIPHADKFYGAKLLELWPTYLGYGLSALVVGIYWVNHHFVGAIYRTAGHRFLLATLLFLAAVGFIAVPTRAFAENILEHDARIAGAHFYVCALAFAALCWWLKWRIGIAQGEIDERLEPAYVERLNRRFAWATLLMGLAAPLVFLRWEAGLALAGVVTLSFLRTPETPQYRKEAPEIEGEG
jgi:uncharacterized membrane protein